MVLSFAQLIKDNQASYSDQANHVDRAPIEESRKWGIYYAINLLFKTFFKLNNASLCKGVLKALSATSKDMPSIDKFPKSQQVTFKYYEGVLAFLEEDYVKVSKFLLCTS